MAKTTLQLHLASTAKAAFLGSAILAVSMAITSIIYKPTLIHYIMFVLPLKLQRHHGVYLVSVLIVLAQFSIVWLTQVVLQ